MKITIHHVHHHPELCELLRDAISLLTENQRGLDMLSREVQDLMTQAKQFTELAPALDAGFKALTLQVSTLQGQIDRLTADGVISAAEKQQLVDTTGSLAAAFSTLQADIPAGTPAAPTTEPDPTSVDTSQTGDGTAGGTTGAAGSGGTGQVDPNAPVGDGGQAGTGSSS
jgi:hypothetical protein